ncbi:MAG: 5-demethoxyubiquinol-8 5-hydroxylase UbiM [Paracoccaceae bacterium]
MQYDIIIIGAGPAGLSFARAMAGSGLSIAIVEKNPIKSLAEPAYDGREIALTHLSHKILNDLGIWQHIPENRHFKIRDAKVINGNSPYSLDFDHRESGRENLGFMVSNSAIRKAVFDALDGFDNITILDGTTVQNIGTNDTQGWVELANGETLNASLIVAADSRFSGARRMMGIPASMLDFGRTCIVCTMSTQENHEQTAVEYFHLDRTLAILPLGPNQVSVVVTLKSDDFDALLSMPKMEFANDIAARTDGQFGQMQLSSERFTYPLVATFAKTFCKNRFALVGDAAVGMHPVTAHGFNLGLQGGNVLATEILKSMSIGQDIANYSALQNYDRAHRRASAPIYHGTNALVQLYTNTSPPARIARSALLHLGNFFTPARGLIMDRLTELKRL